MPTGPERVPPSEAPSGGLPSLARVRDTASLFKLVAFPGRLVILLALAEGEATFGDLLAHVGAADQSSFAHLLAPLRQTGLVDRRRSGRSMTYSLTASGRLLADVVSRLVGRA